MPLLVALSGWRGRPGVFPGTSLRRGFALGTCAGLVYFTGTVYWTGAVVSTFGGLPAVVAWLCAFALAAYMTVYLAMAAALLGRAVAVSGARALWLAPALWVAGEFARGHVLGGFPWVPLGSSMATLLPIVQLASLVGVYGVSLYLVAHSVLVTLAITGTRRTQARAAVAAVAVLLAVSIWGGRRVADAPLTREGTPVALGLVQADIRQNEKWNPRHGRRDRTPLRPADPAGRRRRSGGDPVAGVVDAVPTSTKSPTARRRCVRSCARPARRCSSGPTRSNAGLPIATTTRPSCSPRTGPWRPSTARCSWCRSASSCRCESLLFFVSPLVEGVSDFSPGDRVTMLPMAGHMASTAICYEIVYPHLSREAVRQGAELLTTVTNDAWYGDSSAPYQHFALASLRAVEQGRYLARAANTGISGVVDPYGRVIGATRVFEEAVVVVEARFLTGHTLYATIGDLVAQLALAVAGLTGLWLAVERRQ